MCVRGFGALLAGEAPSCGGSPREGARSELANGAATGGGGRSAPDPDRPRAKVFLPAGAAFPLSRL